MTEPAPDPPPGVDHLCLFAHFDPDGAVDDYVLFYLGHLRRAGFEIVFVSTAALDAAACARLGPLCREVIVRPNVGHDFWSWREGFRRHAGAVRGDLLLANDSVYGPITDLAEAVSALRRTGADFAGLVRSHEIADHLQSWFLLFRNPLVHEGTLEAVLDRDFGRMPKEEIVRQGEIALSALLHARGFRSAALTDAAPGLRTRLAYNPTHYFWRELVERHGVPFVKVDLLRDNRGRMRGTGRWRAVIAARCPELVPLIERHLARVRPGAPDRHDLAAPRAVSRQGFIGRDYRWHARPAVRAANRLLYQALVLVGRRLPAALTASLRWGAGAKP